MTVLDTRMPAAAASMLARFGVSGTYRQDTDHSYDPATGEVRLGGSGATTIYTVTVTPPVPISVDWITTGFAKDGSSVVYLSAQDTDATALAFTPKQGDTVEIASQTWKVVGLQKYRSGDSTAAWGLAVTGGST